MCCQFSISGFLYSFFTSLLLFFDPAWLTEKLLSLLGQNLFISCCTTYTLPNTPSVLAPEFFFGWCGFFFFMVFVSDRSTPGVPNPTMRNWMEIFWAERLISFADRRMSPCSPLLQVILMYMSFKTSQLEY